MSWRTPSLWRRSTLKETLYRRTRSTGGRSCWRCPVYARSTPPSSASEAPCTVHPLTSVFTITTLPAPPTKKQKAYIILSTHTCLTKLYSHLYTNTHSNFKLTHGSLDIHVCMYALTHTLILFIRLDIIRRNNCPHLTTVSWFVLCFLWVFCMWLTVWRCHLSSQDASGNEETINTPLQLHCNQMRR